MFVNILIANISSAQFYIGCDTLIENPSGYRHAANILIGYVEFYHDSSSNRFLLVSNLDKRKIVHPFSYQIMKDSITNEDYLLLKRYETIKMQLDKKKPINELKKYRNFMKINRAGDSAYLAESEYINDGIDKMEALWDITDNEISCKLYIDFKSNTPRQSHISYYYLDFGSPCLNVKSQSPYNENNYWL